MGNAQTLRVDEPRVFLQEYSDLVYQDVLASYKLFKVMQCVVEREGKVVVKLFIQRDGMPDLQQLRFKVLQVREALKSFWLHPHVHPYQGMEVSAKSAVLLRPFFSRNLFERIYSRPFLSDMMKNWIAFQVLCAVCQAHSVGVAHGDLKTENIFITSWNHTVVSDFALFKPLHLPHDDPSEFTFFFESNLSRPRCYLAPERFDASTGRTLYFESSFSKTLAAMDIFSLGCVLAELFLDGQTLLELPELLLYRNKQLDLQSKISCIGNPDVQELIASMLQRDPMQRGIATDYLRAWCSRVLPTSISRCIFPLSVLLLHPAFQHPEMRVLLLRHNFANILWSVVGGKRIAASMGLDLSEAGVASARSSWQSYVQQRVRSVPEAAGVNLSSAAGNSQPSFLPTLNEAASAEFTKKLFDTWDEGFRRSAACGGIETNADNMAFPIFQEMLSSFCAAGDGQDADHKEAEEAAQESPEEGSAERSTSKEDALSIVCGFICSTIDHLSNPRMKMICLDMLVEAAPFSSQAVALEQILPYSHNLMADPIAKVSAKAIGVLARCLEFVEELPLSEASLFTEYIFPQLMYAMSGRSQFGGGAGEPVVLLAVAQNIAPLGKHALRLSERTVAVAQRGASSGNSPAEAARASRHDGSKASGVEAFDVQWLRVRRAVEKVVSELVSVTQQPQSQMGADSQKHVMEEDLQNIAMGREIKVALLRSMGVLAEVFGRDGTQHFLLPYVVTFMNDPSWEVRAAFCEWAACLPPMLGQVSTEGMLWPCYEQAVVDPEGRVLESVLRGLKRLVDQKVLRRQLLVAVVAKVAPLLVHPSRAIQILVLDVLDAVSAQMSQVEQYVFLVPILSPYLCVEVVDSLGLEPKLESPVSRAAFKKVVVARDRTLCDSLAKGKPSLSEELAPLELLRPYLQLLLKKDVAGSVHGLEHHQDEGDVFQVPLASVQSAPYTTVNPHCLASRSLQALAELSDCNKKRACSSFKIRSQDVGLLQSLISQVLALSEQTPDLGVLSSIDGAPFSIYAKPKQATQSSPREREASSRADSSEGVCIDSLQGAALLNPCWRPRGTLLATLYEYAHQGGIPVVKVDTTDDSRILITGGKDGVVKIWNCAALEHDVAVSSSYTFQVPDDGHRRAQRLRSLCTIRNSKAFAVGSDSGKVHLYRMQPSPSSMMASEVCKLPSSTDLNMPLAVMCMEHFDTDLESLLVFARQHGEVTGWDVRSAHPCWSYKPNIPGLGVPSAMSLRSDGHSILMGTYSGALMLFDLRFLAPWRTWTVSSNAPILALRSVGSQQCPGGVLTALGSDTNEIAIFDAARGSCDTLFLTDTVAEKTKDSAVSVPALRELKVLPASRSATGSFGSDMTGPRKDSGSVRCLWSCANAPSRFFLAAGTDRQVRYWSLERQQAETSAYMVTASEQADRGRDRPKYTSNQLGDVFVVQEQMGSRSETMQRQGHKGMQGADDGKSRGGVNPNHRDAILDMCVISLQQDILITAGRDGLVKLWK